MLSVFGKYMKRANDIILTGIPRSGTTLTCHLLNKLPNFVALHEPITPSEYFSFEINVVVEKISNFFEEQRQSILVHKRANSKSVSGAVPDNIAGSIDKSTGKRKRLINGDTIIVDKPLDKDFHMAIKQPNMFTAILERLVDSFDCFSIVRNPLSVLLSWNSVDMPVTRWHAPAAEAFDTLLANALRVQKDKYLRQIILLNWYFEKYNKNLEVNQILRYEDIIATGGRTLAVICDAAVNLHEPLNSKNRNTLYDQTLKKSLRDLLLSHGGAFMNFYDEKDIVAMG